MPDKTYHAAIYTRLSRDDERAGESLSIENQKMLLDSYAAQHGFANCVHYTDESIVRKCLRRKGFPVWS